MTRWRKWTLLAAGVAAALALLLAAAGVAVVRSDWFREKVRLRMIAEAERATGGRVELGSYAFDPWRLTARVDRFLLRGTEGPEEPPLFEAGSIEVGLRVVSAFRRDIDLASIVVRNPRIHIIVAGRGLPKLTSQIYNAGEPQNERDFLYRQDLVFELQSVLDLLRGIIDDIEFLMRADDPDYVYWIEPDGIYEDTCRVAAAPIEVGGLLKELLYDKKDTIVFSSATLTVDGMARKVLEVYQKVTAERGTGS